MQTEYIIFRLIQMPCCKHLYYNVNPRLPNYCPECGVSTGGGQLLKPCILFSDDSAFLTHKNKDI